MHQFGNVLLKDSLARNRLADTKKLVESAPVAIKETDGAAAKALVKSLEAIGAKAKAEVLKK